MIDLFNGRVNWKKNFGADRYDKNKENFEIIVVIRNERILI